MNRTLVILLIFFLITPAVLMTGCGKTEPPKQEPPPKEEKKLEPEKKEEEEMSTIEMDDPELVMKRKKAYMRENNMRAGTLLGGLRFKGKLKRARDLEISLIDMEKGEYALKGADGREIAYYKNIQLKEEKYIKVVHDTVYPAHAVIMIENIKKGRKPMIEARATYINQGRISDDILFSPIYERYMIGTKESYATDIVVEHLETGKEVFKGNVKAMVQTPVLREYGIYSVKSTNHPWKEAFAVVVVNPYVADASYNFTIRDIPVGKHTLRVWHPAYEPEQKTYEIDIAKDETTEIIINFKAPDFLKK
jgi:hypothetical protein